MKLLSSEIFRKSARIYSKFYRPIQKIDIIAGGERPIVPNYWAMECDILDGHRGKCFANKLMKQSHLSSKKPPTNGSIC